MSSPHVENDVFMSELTLMLHNCESAGEVTVTMKRYDGRTKPHPKCRTIRKKGTKGKVVVPASVVEKPSEYLCLLRAQSKHKKISTVVSPAKALKFQGQFIQLMRSSMDGLKKEKKLKKKAKKTA